MVISSTSSSSLPFSSSDVVMCLLLALDAASDEVEVAAICFPGKSGTASSGRLNLIMIEIKRHFGSTFSNDFLSTGKK